MFSRLTQSEIVVKVTKRKLSLGGLAAQLFLLARRNRRNVTFDAILLHAATVAEEIHLVHLLLIFCLEFLPLQGKLGLQLFFLCY